MSYYYFYRPKFWALGSIEISGKGKRKKKKKKLKLEAKPEIIIIEKISDEDAAIVILLGKLL
jgi:hypothetical protein